MENNVFCILVDPSQVEMADVISIGISKGSKFKGVNILRWRSPYWRKVNPIQIFFVDNSTKQFDNLESLKEYIEESKNG